MRHDKNLTLSTEYLLLLLDDDKGRLVIDSTTADIGLSGAVLLDLIAQGHLALDETEQKPGKQKLRALGPGPADEDLAEACRKVDGRSFGKAIEIISGWASFRSRAKNLRENELRRLVAAGILVEQQAKVLGIFPVDRFPTRDDSVERGIRRDAEDVLVRGATPDERTGALIALLHATGALPKVFRDQNKGDLKRRGKEISQGDWASAEVKKAVEGMQGAMAAIAVASTAAASSAST